MTVRLATRGDVDATATAIAYVGRGSDLKLSLSALQHHFRGALLLLNESPAAWQ